MTNNELKKKKSPAVKCEPVSYTVGGKTTIHQPQTPRRGVSELMMELNRSLEGSAQQPLVRELIACYITERVDSYYEHAPLSTRPLSYPQPNRLSSYVKDLLAR